MSGDPRKAVLREFGVVADESGGRRPDSQSGAGVWAARTAAGDAAYLKVTSAAQGPGPVSAARRELRFYREVAPAAPVRTPRLLDHRDDEAGVALLLAAAGEPQSPTSWTTSMWGDLGHELAALHRMPLPTGAHWRGSDALTEALTDAGVEEVKRFWADTLPQLSRIVADRTRLQEGMAAPSPVFRHGDCHTDNILHSGGALVFCDWQSAGIGRPASDLAFLSVRATPSGTVIPPALLDAYLENRPCDRRLLNRALVAEELATFLFLWPPYAAFNSPSRIARVVRRTRELARLWLAGPGV